MTYRWEYTGDKGAALVERTPGDLRGYVVLVDGKEQSRHWHKADASWSARNWCSSDPADAVSRLVRE